MNATGAALRAWRKQVREYLAKSLPPDLVGQLAQLPYELTERDLASIGQLLLGSRKPLSVETQFAVYECVSGRRRLSEKQAAVVDRLFDQWGRPR